MREGGKGSCEREIGDNIKEIREKRGNKRERGNSREKS